MAIKYETRTISNPCTWFINYASYITTHYFPPNDNFMANGNRNFIKSSIRTPRVNVTHVISSMFYNIWDSNLSLSAEHPDHNTIQLQLLGHSHIVLSTTDLQDLYKMNFLARFCMSYLIRCYTDWSAVNTHGTCPMAPLACPWCAMTMPNLVRQWPIYIHCGMHTATLSVVLSLQW